MIGDLCKTTLKNIRKYKIKTLSDVKKHRGVLAQFSEEMKKMLKELREFLFTHFYLNPKIEVFTLRGKRMIKKLFEYYLKNSNKFPKKEFLKKGSDIRVAVKDYIAGMTDGFLIGEYGKIEKDKLKL